MAVGLAWLLSAAGVLLGRLPSTVFRLPVPSSPLVSTFSIVARDPANGDLGVAVASRFPNVRVVVPFARADVGAVATQALADSDFGTRGLELLAHGAAPAEVIDGVGRGDPEVERRQVGMVDAQGRSATFTGKRCLEWAGGRSGTGYAVQGNALVSEKTVAAMEKAFLATSGPLADRLLASIKAGAGAGGDRGGRRSAALLVVRKGGSYDGKTDAYVDISVYDARDPTSELFRLYGLQKIHFQPSDPRDLVPIRGEDARFLQRMLARRGFLKAERSDGVWDEASTEALADYMVSEGYDKRIRRDGRIDKIILKRIREKEEEVPIP